MHKLQKDDVPYGNDWDNAEEVADWAEAAEQKRPWRAQIRDHIAGVVAKFPHHARILELGSGPGFLAQRVLEGCPDIQTYTLLDFSNHMLGLSRARLAGFPAARFVLGSFKSEDWPRQISGPVDCVVAMQSVHELRHKRYATRLYEQVYQVLSVPGLFAICDHLPFDDSAKNVALYMTEEEQHQALTKAGFVNVHTELSINGLVVYTGEKAE